MTNQLIRTNVVLDKSLVEQALRETGFRTRRELIDYALREVIRHKNQRKLRELKGTVRWDGDLDAMRQGHGA